MSDELVPSIEKIHSDVVRLMALFNEESKKAGPAVEFFEGIYLVLGRFNPILINIKNVLKGESADKAGAKRQLDGLS